MHKKACKQFAEDKQTKNMDYWNHVLWSDETKINLFGSEGVKRVRWQPGEEYKASVSCLQSSVVVWVSWSDIKPDIKSDCDILKQSMIPPFRDWAAGQYSNMEYLQKYEGCTHFCEILYIFCIYIYTK